MDDLKIVELFAGIGGVAGGLLDAGGFEPVLLIDREPLAAKVFKGNFPAYATRFYTRSVDARLSGSKLCELAGSRIDGILGCPPCQGFSAAGLRDPDDARNELLEEMRRLIASVKPLFFLMENVPSLSSSRQFERFSKSLESKYKIASRVLNAAEFGIPQLRRRLVVFGIHCDAGVSPSFPAPTHGGAGRVFDYCSGRYLLPSSHAGRHAFQVHPELRFARRRMVTLSAALDDLPADPPMHRRGGESSDAPLEYAGPALTAFQRRMRRHSRRLTHHVAWRHRSGLIGRLARIAPGDCPPGNGGRSRNTEYFSQAYARLHPSGLARTVTTNFHNPGSGRFTHYAKPRALTLREAMRLQSFPDNFVLPEMHLSDAERLIGNAFPRRLAEVLGRHIGRLLGGR